MPVSAAAIQTALLTILKSGRTDKRLGQGRYYLYEEVAQAFAGSERPTQRQVMSAIWSLIGQGLAYIDHSQPSPDNWRVELSESGRRAADDEQVNPDDAGAYIDRLRQRVPDASPTVLMYADESVRSYMNRCYLASAVMLGVASEAAFLEMATAFGSWLPVGQHQKYVQLIGNPHANFISKFGEFRKRLEPFRTDLPSDLADGLTLTLDAVLDLLRIYRNDAGHPTGKSLDREQAFINLQMFSRYLEKLYALKTVFK